MGLTEQFNALSEDSFSALLELSKERAVLLLDRNGKIISCNKNAEIITGYSMHEMHGLPFFVLYRNNTAESEYLSILELAKKSGTYITKDHCKRKDGSSFSAIINLTALPDGKEEATKFILILDTPSESNKITDTLHLARLIERTTDAILSTDLQFKIISWNKAAEKLYGYNREEVIGKLLKDIVRPNLTKEIYESIDNGIKQHGFWIGEVVHMNRGGRALEIEESISVTKDKGNKIDGYVWICRDITALKKNERQLLQMARLIENTSDAIYSITTSNMILSWNKAAEKMYGYKAIEVLNKLSQEILQPQLTADVRIEISRALIEKGIWKGEVNHKRKDGTIFPVLISVNAVKNSEGSIHEYLCLCTDITEVKNAVQRKSEKKILKEKELSDSIINSLPGIFYLFDSNGKFLRWNKQFETVSGYSSEEISEMTPDMFFEGEDKIFVGEKIKLVFTEGYADVEAAFVSKNKSTTPYYFNGVFINYDEKPCLIGMGININERKKAERELFDSEQKYKMLFDNNPLPMWMFTIPDRNIIEVNMAAVSHYGYTRNEFLSLNLLDLRPEEDKAIFLEEIRAAVTGIRRAGIWRHKMKDGTIIYVEIFRDDIIYKGQPVRLVLANDITEKFITEQRLKESHEELRNLASHLQDIREEERSVIAREIHDELGQQITGLKMDVSWISKRLKGEDATVHQKIKNVLELLDETVKTVRKIATELRPSILDDLGLIDALQWYSLEFEKRFGIPVSFRTAIEEVQTGKNVAIGLFRIYQESLTNVARHSGATFVSTIMAIKDDTLRLTITDNGKGFDAGTAGKRKHLGLLGMKERTLMMGGLYEINSIPGTGTTVNVSVPLQAT